MKFQSFKKDRKSLGLTLYMDGFSAVKEVRGLASEAVVDEVEFWDIAKRIEPDSIVIRGLGVIEHVYDGGSPTGRELLESYIGSVVTIRNPELGQESQIRLLNTADGIVGERTDTREILLNPSGELILPPLPEGFKVKPSIICGIMPAALNQEVHISYVTQGLEWEVVYTLEIREEAFELTGWVCVYNGTGYGFDGALLKLIAGQVNRHGPRLLSEEANLLHQRSLPVREPFEEHRFADKHVYTLGRAITLLDGQSKQISFLSAQGGTFKKAYLVERTSDHAKIILWIGNTENNGLGIPLPKGIVKVYEIDDDGEMEFTGEDAIGHTPIKERLSLTIGEAFDIVSESREVARDKRDGLEYVKYRYELRNRKQENVRIDIRHAIYEPFWKMESSTHDYEVKNASEVEFNVRVAAGKSASVLFTYKADSRIKKN